MVVPPSLPHVVSDAVTSSASATEGTSSRTSASKNVAAIRLCMMAPYLTGRTVRYIGAKLSLVVAFKPLILSQTLFVLHVALPAHNLQPVCWQGHIGTAKTSLARIGRELPALDFEARATKRYELPLCMA